MINLLLIDDELFALEALKNSIPLADCGMDQVFTCSNITAAKNICEKESIHLIICDIEMPNGTGLDFARWLSSQHPEIILIFLTCHSDFEYAREAISYHVFSYLLKPFDLEEVTKTLKDAVAQIQEEQELATQASYSENPVFDLQMMREHFWQRLVRGIYKDSTCDYILWDAERNHVLLSPETVYVPVVFYLTSPLPSQLEPSILLFCVKNAISELFLFSEEQPPVIDLTPETYLFLADPDTVQNQELFQETCSQLFLFFKTNFFVTLQCVQGTPCHYPAIPSQLTLLTEQIQTALAVPEALPSEETSHQIVEKILSLIKENKRISRESLAKAVFLSTDYMSKLFKKETGKKLSEYLTEVKLTEAKYLLGKTNTSISEIASSLGYANFSYFSKMFKAETGMSPGEYRKHYKE